MSFAISTPQKAEIAFKHAEQLKESSRYEEALLEFQDIGKEFPYSKYAKISKLKVADVHFDMASYIQAQYQYQYYFDLYPKEANSDYALYRVGLSMYKLLPKTVDRDLTGTTGVLKAWRNLLVKFPKSKFTPEILKYQKKLLKDLGEKELYIANFYLKKKKYVSAQRRINKLFKEFPSFEKNKKALATALACAKGLGDEPAIRKYSDLLKKAN
ncbi:MAG: outer membrane protein assembly factor BamD [Bdellovibrionales bacterium]